MGLALLTAVLSLLGGNCYDAVRSPTLLITDDHSLSRSRWAVPFFLIHLQPWVCLCYNTKCIRHGSHCLRGSLAAWRSHGTSNATLISNLRSNGLITTDRVYKSMLNVDRANYVLNKQRAYEDCPQSISYGATISAPHVRSSLILIA